MPPLPRLRRGPLLALAALVLGAGLIGANCTPKRYATLVASGFSQPIFLTAPAGDPRLFVVEATGRIWIVEDGEVLPTPFLNIRSLVSTNGEQGLLGLAFSPDYATDREFYVYYVDLLGDSILARYRTKANDPDAANAESAEIILRVDQPAGEDNHKGGTIAFSPVDGMLYWALGDGGMGAKDPANPVQNPQSPLGKMLRLDVSGGAGTTYSIPADNPFVGDDGVLDEIWSSGFRNPFRFSFDRVTGDLWIGDVGQGLREEVDFESADDPGGRNYGWNVQEGTLCFQNLPELPCESPAAPDRFTFPVHEYVTHEYGTCAITGGVVYRGSAPSLQGYYVFSDYCSDRIEALRPDGSLLNVTKALVVDEGTIDGIVAIGEDGFGEAYLVGIVSGQIHRID